MSSNLSEEVRVRRAKPEDAAACGQICYDAFNTLNTRHGFPCDLPDPDVARELLAHMFSHPHFYCVVAEEEGRIVGSNCLDERSEVAGLGPITVDPALRTRERAEG